MTVIIANMSQDFKQQALIYHEFPQPGKITTAATKPLETAWDLTLAYSPGVAEPAREIARDPADVYRYAAKGNLIAVISNGSAVLGLGNLGPLAAKPVMEGKAVLFKRFANIDVFDIEIVTQDPAEFIQTVKNIAPTFGGINLEDIKAPECFAIEQALIEQCDIPIFHDDQHGTAIVIAAGLLNALELQGKAITDAQIVCLGAGAAAYASVKLLIQLGAKLANIFLIDTQGVIHSERKDLNKYKAEFAHATVKRTLPDALLNADVLIGLSGAGTVTADLLKIMAPKPIIFACSNPDPEIAPELAKAARPDAILATGRSDYPNQVNNVLVFPFIFRGALDAKAKCINDAMKLAAVHALKELAKQTVPTEILAAYPYLSSQAFGPDYIIPTPLDPRLLSTVAPAVAQAAIATKVTH